MTFSLRSTSAQSATRIDRMWTLKVSFLLFCAVLKIQALPQGAPARACESLAPSHGGTAPQTTEAPYVIKVSSTKIEKGGSVHVTLEGATDETFRGILIHARPSRDEYNVVGSIAIDQAQVAKTIECMHPDDTITHSGNDYKSSIAFTWTSSVDYEGPIVFTGTFLKERDIYWVKVSSRTVQVGDQTGTTTTPGTTTTTATTPTDSTFYSGCGTTKSCLGYPPKCIGSQSCDFAMSVVKAETNNYKFELISYQASKGYVALALSGKDRMSDSSVMECVHHGGNVQSHSSWMQDRSVSRENIPQNLIRLTNSSNENNIFWCELERNIETSVNGQTFNLDNTKYNLLLASGSDVDDTGIHYHDIGMLATPKESLSTIKIYGEVSSIEYKLHGIFMVISWLGMTSIGVVCARYFKTSFSGKQLFGKDLWFIIHMGSMYSTWILAITATILVFVKNGGWVSIDNPHPILGAISTTLCFLQPIGAFFRPGPKAPSRVYFNWGHFSAGNLAHLFGILAIFFSVSLTKAQLPSSTYIVFGTYVAYYICMHIILTTLQYKECKNSDKIKQILFVIHVISVLTLTITAVVFISLAPF